ncbi:pyrroline-5-carboxylate reductase 2 isoform X1 [Centruroides vittatus]|uniref:pyrroline-5-carboxylate reductase 2 isoform X1 n=2 Tax=Centruroides vittatus TaxID=120091 RepID=UPI0035106C30
MLIGFLGAGRMALALAKGFVAAGITKAENIIASSPKDEPSMLEEMKSLGFNTTYENAKVVGDSNVVVLSLKPPVVPKVLSEITGLVTDEHLMISIALGIPIRSLEQMLPRKSRVVRVMPNTPALVMHGMSVFCCGTSTLEIDSTTTSRLLSSVGTCEEVPETLIDAVTGVSGSGPAYIYMAIEALADGGVKMGIPRDLSQKLAAYTVMGAAKMVLETGRHPGALKDDVCSPAGCTIEAVHRLEKSGFRSALIEAVEAATLKSKQTGARNVS